MGNCAVSDENVMQCVKLMFLVVVQTRQLQRMFHFEFFFMLVALQILAR